MVDQTLALQVKQPDFNYGRVLEQAQGIRGREQDLKTGEIKGQLAQMEFEDTTRERGALNAYRDAREAGDPGAMGKLAAYPELQAKFHQAIESMKPDERKAALDRSRAIGEAARYVASFPEGSPERAAAWAKSIDGLVKAKHIPADVGEEYKRGGPSDLILDQALSIDDWIQKYGEGGDKKVDAATAAIEKGVADFRQTITPKDSYPTGDDAAEIERRVEAERQRLEKLYRQDKRPVVGQRPGAAPAKKAPTADDVGVLDLKPKAAKAPGGGNIGIGTIIRNPNTGQRRQWDGEQWVDLK